MTVDPDDLLQAFRTQADPTGKDAWAGRRETTWEATAVRKVLKGLRLGAPRAVEEACRDLGGAGELRFIGLDRAFEGLPVRFAAARVQGHALTDLDARFTKTALYTAYQREQELDDASERPLALVFPWSERFTAVMYTGTPDYRFEGCVIVRMFAKVIFTIDSLPRYLKVLDTTWLR